MGLGPVPLKNIYKLMTSKFFIYSPDHTQIPDLNDNGDNS